MGEAKRRAAEIAKLKAMSPEEAARYRQLRDDERRIAYGLDPNSTDPEMDGALARALFSKLEAAKSDFNISGFSEFLYDKINGTIIRLADEPIACAKGCSHCCHVWVSVSAPEVIHIAKVMKERNPELIPKVREANEHTRQFNWYDRGNNPYACPLLKDDICQIYDYRPKGCRLASSHDAVKCFQGYMLKQEGGIPTPGTYLFSRAGYEIAIAVALKRAGFPVDPGYEYNAALVRVFDTEGAERRWLSGENIFDGVLCQDEKPPIEQINYMYEEAFGKIQLPFA